MPKHINLNTLLVASVERLFQRLGYGLVTLQFFLFYHHTKFCADKYEIENNFLLLLKQMIVVLIIPLCTNKEIVKR